MSFKSEVEILRAKILRMEETILAIEKRLQEKMHECVQLGGDLDRARDMAARALQRAIERSLILRQCMQTTVAELERQLASSRGRVKNVEKEKAELQPQMQCQIKGLNENFEPAQFRILGLQTQLISLRRTAFSSSDEEVDGEDDGEGVGL